ncbi:MAG: DUF4924 family protein [Rikenellaceae bacterium]|jgi:hypothetical protein|nr:DUF4924 family protein [Rikenellaceae bacterium]
MYIARAKRRENIAEYVLYLWQLEDLLRALDFGADEVWRRLVEPCDVGEAERQELFLWYMELANLLKEEGKTASGHLEHTLHIVADLQNLHNRLMSLPAAESYRRAYATLAPELPRLRATVGREVTDVELCFRALYGAMLYKMKGEREMADDVLRLASPVVAQLADAYRRAERGELDLFEE